MTCQTATLRLLTLALLLCSTPAATAAFPGKNGRIVFDSFGSGREGEDEPAYRTGAIEDVKPNGDGDRTLISCTETEDHPDEGDCSLRAGQAAEFGEPSYSPDGRRIVFLGAFQIGVMNADGSGRRLFETTTGNPTEPAFSPDGKHVVFTDRGGARRHAQTSTSWTSAPSRCDSSCVAAGRPRGRCATASPSFGRGGCTPSARTGRA